MRKYTKWTKELLEPIVSSSQSYSQCLVKMGLKAAGGNYKNLIKNISKFALNTDHMTHQTWNAGKELKPFDDLVTPAAIKRRLISEKGHSCEGCGLSSWLDCVIPLELEHIDGNNLNNDKHNLKLLCPNCHALTPTWRRWKRHQLSP